MLRLSKREGTTSEIEAQPGKAGVSAPSPGRAVRGSRTGRPIMAALDLLGRRWALRVLWELRDGSAASFRELRDRCDKMSTSVLNQRLTELREAGLVDAGAGGYFLTKRGAELEEALAPWTLGRSAGARAPRGRGQRRNPPQGAERPLPRRAQPPPSRQPRLSGTAQ